MSFKRGTSIKKTADKTTRKVNKTSIVQYLILGLKVITFQSYKFILFLEIQQKNIIEHQNDIVIKVFIIVTVEVKCKVLLSLIQYPSVQQCI